jgi:hypothetical protein
MTKYDERNSSKKEMKIEEAKAFLTAKKSRQRLIVLTFNSSHWHCSASRQPFGREPNARRCTSC